MKIRQGIEDDSSQIYRIEKLVFPESYWTREMIKQELQETSSRITWVIEEKELIGYCMVRFGPDEVHIINMAIEPKSQKMGIGQKLLFYFLDHIPSKSSVFLEVKRGNYPAINLYLKAGFEEISIREKYYSTGEDAIIMCMKN